MQQEIEKIRTQLLGTASFRLLKVELDSGGEIVTEAGSMASQDAGLATQTRLNGGGIWQAFLLRFLGKESFFVNSYKNSLSKTQSLYITQSTPGDIIERRLENERIYIECGSFLARERGVRMRVEWAGFSSFLAGEGLFRLSFEGSGRIWYGCYGAVIEKEIHGDFIVDSGHLLSYPPSVQLKVKLAGGIFSSIFSGEGLVLKLKGSGRIQIQTRSVKGLAQWLNQRFWG